MCWKDAIRNAIAAFKHSIELRPSLDAYGNLGYTYTLMHRVLRGDQLPWNRR